jgi:two-component system, OmpR family, response regulator
MTNTADILLVEDDENLGFLIKDTLNAHGWNVHLHASGEKGLSAFHSNRFHLCILDVMLPQKDGFTLAEEIRKFNQHVPIMFLTARSQAQDRIRGFQAGADDYVCKPFSIEEFKYRIEAILKRTNAPGQEKGSGILNLSASTLDLNNYILNANGVITRLTHKETRLLEMFFRCSGKLIQRDVFLKSIWEDDGFFVARSMDVFVSKVRKYLKPDTGLVIENVRSIGYILKEVK